MTERPESNDLEMSEKAKLSDREAAKAISVTRGTLRSYIKSARVNTNPDGTIDVAELLRAGFILRTLPPRLQSFYAQYQQQRQAEQERQHQQEQQRQQQLAQRRAQESWRHIRMNRYPEPLTSASLPTPPERINNFWYLRRNPARVLVFVHGIFSDSRGCWLFEDIDSMRRVFWPDIVSGDRRLGDVSIFLAGYYTALDAGNFPTTQCAREVFEALQREDTDGTPPVLDAQELIFVCHSTGGIVVRYLLERYQSNFREKGIGLTLISSPSLGSVWANVASLAARYYNQQLGLQLRWRNDALEDLHSRFRDLVNRRMELMPRLYGVEACETKFILREKIPQQIRRLLPNRLKVVNTLSAGQYFGDLKFIRDTDHFSIVKPDGPEHPSHEFLVTFLSGFQKFLQENRPSSAHMVNEIDEEGLDVHLDITSDTNRSVLLRDEVYLDEEGAVNLSFPRLIARQTPTPKLNLSFFGLTTSGREVKPTEARCTVSHPGGKQSVYNKLQGTGPDFVLPRTEEAIVVRVSLAFRKGDEELKGIKVLVMDEYGRELSQILEG
jgi:hypothetical protein